MKQFLTCLLITIVFSISYLVNTPRVFAQPVIDDSIGSDTYGNVNQEGGNFIGDLVGGAIGWIGGAFNTVAGLTKRNTPATPAEPTAPVCNSKGDIDPNTWQFRGEVCNKVKQGEVAEEWQCEKIIKYANSLPDEKCALGSGIECDCFDSGDRSYNTCNSGCSEFGTVGIQCTKQEQCKTRVRPQLIGPNRITDEIGTIDVNYFSTGIDRVCGEISDPAKKEVCNKDASSCFNAIKDATSVDERERASLNFAECVNKTKNKALTEIVKTIQEQLKEEYGAWVGAYCASVWTIHKGKGIPLDETNGSKCEAAVARAGCQNLPPDDDSSHPKLVSCIRSAADRLFKPSTATPRDIIVQVPGAVTDYNTDFDKHIYAWCGDGNGVTADKKDACALKAFNDCNKETAVQKFIECVQKVAKEGYGGKALAEEAKVLEPPSRGTPAQRAPQRPAKKTPSASALINGSTGEVILPSDTKSVQVGGQVKDGENCLDTAISLTFFKIEENGQKLAPPKLITLKPHDAAFLAGLPKNCTTYSASLDEKSGKYQISVQLTDSLASKTVAYTSSQVATNTLTVTQAPATPATAKVFSCQTSGIPTGPNSITGGIINEGELPKAYDRVNWYIGKESVTFKGTYLLGQVTEFTDLEPNTSYTLQAEYYSQDTPAAERKGHVTCIISGSVKTPAARQGRVKSTPKQLAAVLGTHTSPISFDILPIVTPESIVAVNVRAVTLDLEGNPSEVLFPAEGNEGIWENGRPLSLTINNPSQVSAVQVTVERNTTTIPISKAAEEVTQLVKAAPQNIDLRMEADINHVTFTAYTVHPVDNPKFIVNDAEQDPAGSTCDQSGDSCVYSWTAYAPFSGSFSVSFGDQTETFNPPEPESAEQIPAPGATPPAGGPKQITNITLSKDDGSEEQVVYTRAETAEADFNLNVGNNGLKYNVEYSDGTSETLLFVVERQASTESQPPAGEPPIPPPQTGGEYCDNVGEYDRVCIDTDGTYKFRQCQDNIWSDWLGSETNPDNACRTE